ncbi:MAG TPA: ferritin-like protein [Propionibacteriaceae bacterium]
MIVADDQWDLPHLHTHLQAAAELEAWTIPYYLAAASSIVDRSCDAIQLIQSVVHQEMLHLQLVANVANAYGFSPVLAPTVFDYRGSVIPHLDFALDPDNPTATFSPYSAAIGPLDQTRINTMCLIEYPEWDTGGRAPYQQDVQDYGSIGEFYDALDHGLDQLASHLVGGVNQVDLFAAFYRGAPTMTVRSSGREGLAQVKLLIDIIRDQGEAATDAGPVAGPFQNTADDSFPEDSHYEKFSRIRGGPLPATYPVKDPSDHTAADTARVNILVDDFARLTGALTAMFAGHAPADFETLMVSIGADLLNCWRTGVTPRFT